MAVKQSAEDTPCMIEQNIAVEGPYFSSLQDRAHGVEEVRDFCVKFGSILNDLNKNIVSLCGGDHCAIASWYFRLANLHAHLGFIQGELERSPFIDWYKVATSMSTLNVHRTAILSTLALNGVRL